MKKCYISGRISGLPWGTVERNFSSAVLQIFKFGYVPVNPLNSFLPRNAPWILHMAVDCIMLLLCDSVAFQSNWRESRGAMIEYKVAKLAKKEMVFL